MHMDSQSSQKITWCSSPIGLASSSSVSKLGLTAQLCCGKPSVDNALWAHWVGLNTCARQSAWLSLSQHEANKVLSGTEYALEMPVLAVLDVRLALISLLDASVN